MRKAGYAQSAIASCLVRSGGTINREVRRRGRKDAVGLERIYQNVYSDDDHGGTLYPHLPPTPKEATSSTRSQKSPWNHS
jgi:IS30 family transposase